MFIAVFGTLPEDSNNIRVKEIIIEDFDLINEDFDKFKNVNEIVTIQNNIYEIHYKILPINASFQIRAISSNPNIRVQIDTLEQIAYVYFDTQQIGQTVTIRITDIDTQVFEEITLWFRKQGEVIIPDLE
jgi:hypothetical protein